MHPTDILQCFFGPSPTTSTVGPSGANETFPTRPAVDHFSGAARKPGTEVQDSYVAPSLSHLSSSKVFDAFAITAAASCPAQQCLFGIPYPFSRIAT